ncbi:7TM diverse intracellular signaling domain-containing protein [Flammeovirga sp. SJP92]|uniref:7TM diverse intracellular signaling domain-containing protein n=1 Tax=Flammeovirga sp. SJP92 TaxID=1775430 RepID=UPI00078729E7|nr:7TM diverse intracellular signaling domain-containing protein [Flammeovirga sp. SJP92]KXX69062.1 hypothetical protein AVL50_18070 [Flammeovirga sp. SJP92]
MINKILTSFTLLITFFVLPEHQAYSQNHKDTIHLYDSAYSKVLDLRHIPFWVDLSQELSYEEILDLKPNFSTSPNQSKDKFNVDGNYWLQLNVSIDSFSSYEWIIEFYDQTIDDIIVYMPTVEGDVEKIFMGDSYDFDKRDIKHINYVIPLADNIDYSQPIYIRIQSAHKVDILLNFTNGDEFIKESTLKYLFFGLYYGAFALMVVYSLMLFANIKEKKYIFYVIHLLFIMLYSSSRDGMGFQFIWPEAPWVNSFSTHLFIFGMTMSLVFFIKEIITDENENSLYTKAMNILMFSLTGIFFLILLFFTTQEGGLLLITTILTLLYFVVKAYKEYKKISPYFIYGLIVFFFGFFIWLLKWYAIVPFNTYTMYSLRISILLEMLLFSYGLYDSLRSLKERERIAQKEVIQHQVEKEEMQNRVIEEQKKTMILSEKVNNELEEKVQERTASLQKRESELRTLNKELQDKSEKLDKLNRILDVNNYNLKGEIKQERERRFTNKRLSHKEFEELFPDQLSCLRYLEKQKWENGFTCKQCGNHTYSDGAKQFSKRCTKCGYNESVTSNTIFHSLKFELTKAFYLSYIISNFDEEFSIQQLSDEIGMSRNTVSKFRAKTLKAKNKESKLLLPTFLPNE